MPAIKLPKNSVPCVAARTLTNTPVFTSTIDTIILKAMILKSSIRKRRDDFDTVIDLNYTTSLQMFFKIFSRLLIRTIHITSASPARHQGPIRIFNDSPRFFLSRFCILFYF